MGPTNPSTTVTRKHLGAEREDITNNEPAETLHHTTAWRGLSFTCTLFFIHKDTDLKSWAMHVCSWGRQGQGLKATAEGQKHRHPFCHLSRETPLVPTTRVLTPPALFSLNVNRARAWFYLREHSKSDTDVIPRVLRCDCQHKWGSYSGLGKVIAKLERTTW